MEVTAKNLIFKGIVLVTINYRLGPLGRANEKALISDLQSMELNLIYL